MKPKWEEQIEKTSIEVSRNIALIRKKKEEGDNFLLNTACTAVHTFSAHLNEHKIPNKIGSDGLTLTIALQASMLFKDIEWSIKLNNNYVPTLYETVEDCNGNSRTNPHFFREIGAKYNPMDLTQDEVLQVLANRYEEILAKKHRP